MENTSTTYQFPINVEGMDHAVMFGITTERAIEINEEFNEALNKLGETEDPNTGSNSKEMIIAMSKCIKSESEALAGAFFMGTAIAKLKYQAEATNPLRHLMELLGDE